MQTIVAATKNQGKIREIARMAGEDKIQVRSMAEMGVNLEVEETGTTFEDNAMLKAEAVWNALEGRYLVLADDSGLEIDYFDGRPGIYSSRWLGETTPYTEKNRIVLERMQTVPEEKRGARYVCAIAAIAPDGRRFTVRETMEGRIADEPQGTEGFGYDPIFWLPEHGCTVAQLPMDVKNGFSHRGKALRAMEARLVREQLL